MQSANMKLFSSISESRIKHPKFSSTVSPLCLFWYFSLPFRGSLLLPFPGESISYCPWHPGSLCWHACEQWWCEALCMAEVGEKMDIYKMKSGLERSKPTFFFPSFWEIIRVVFNGVKTSKDCMKERNNIQSLFFFLNFLNISLLLTYTASRVAHVHSNIYAEIDSHAPSCPVRGYNALSGLNGEKDVSGICPDSPANTAVQNSSSRKMHQGLMLQYQTASHLFFLH